MDIRLEADPLLNDSPWLIEKSHGPFYMIKQRVSPQQIYLEKISGPEKGNSQLVTQKEIDENFTRARVSDTI